MKTTPQSSLALAIEKAGGTGALASALGITSQAISQWNKVPAERCLAVEKLTGVSRFQLRPDIYGNVEAA